MKLKFFLVGILVLFFCFGVKAQNKTDKWVIGLGGSFIRFSDASVAFPGEEFNFQIPNIFISRYIKNGISVEGGLTLTAIKGIKNVYRNEFELMSVDLYASYDFKMSDKVFVPRVMVGSSLLVRDLITKGFTFDVGMGATYWVTSKIGLNTKIVYKQIFVGNITEFDSHAQVSGAILFSLGDYRTRNRRRGRGAGFCSY
ncbi:hypothetical protein ACFLRU_02830 [Bacteroidota bacterium]